MWGIEALPEFWLALLSGLFLILIATRHLPRKPQEPNASSQ